MTGKKRKLEDIKREGKESERRATQMKDDVAHHKKEVDALEKASSALKEARTELESDRSERDIQDLDRARDAAKKSLEDLKTERDHLLSENEIKADSVSGAQKLNRKASAQLGQLRGAATGEVARVIEEKTNSLKAEWDELNATGVVLSVAKLKLQTLEIG